MKKTKSTSLVILSLLLLSFYSCSEDPSSESATEIIQEVSEIQVGNRTMKRAVSYEVTSIGDKVTSKNLLSVSIDGEEMTQNSAGDWEIKRNETAINTGSPNPVKSEAPTLGGEEICDTTSSSQTMLLELGGFGLTVWCVTTVSTTCYSATMENGVLVTTITYSENQFHLMGFCH